jgi:hypothetical protein
MRMAASLIPDLADQRPSQPNGIVTPAAEHSRNSTPWLSDLQPIKWRGLTRSPHRDKISSGRRQQRRRSWVLSASPRVIIAHAVRVILFARPTVASTKHEQLSQPRVVPPANATRALPPADRCIGVRSNQAATCQPDLNCVGSTSVTCPASAARAQKHRRNRRSRLALSNSDKRTFGRGRCRRQIM